MIKLNGKEVKLERFPDRTLRLNDCVIRMANNKITWHYESDEEIFALYCLTKHIRNAVAGGHLTLRMPYIPNGRMDRIKHPKEVFTLKYFTELINDMDFDEVEVYDPHSYVSEALIDKIVVCPPTRFIYSAIDEIVTKTGLSSGFVYYFPDSGAVKRYTEVIPLSPDQPVVYGLKNRDWATGKILGLDVAGDVDKVAGEDVLIVDDICSRGGTFYHSAKKLKELGAKNIYLYITHCENTILEGELLDGDLITRVFTTNSIFTKEHEKIEVFEIW